MDNTAQVVQTKTLLNFRGKMGRLLTLCAQALSLEHTNGQPYHINAVMAASRGVGTSRDPRLVAIRQACAVKNAALECARQHGNETGPINECGRQVRRAVESEWDVRMPVGTFP